MGIHTTSASGIGSLTASQITSALLGAAIGDAFGVPFEFLDADQVAKHPLDAMYAASEVDSANSRPRRAVPAGAWSDDTSMAVATMESIISHQGRLDLTDIMRQFLAWWEERKYCSIERPFGLGMTVMMALGRFQGGAPALESGATRVRDNGNGALMRIFPIALHLAAGGHASAGGYGASCGHTATGEHVPTSERAEATAPNPSREQILSHEPPPSRDHRWNVVSQASQITHGHAISQLSCIIFCEFLWGIHAGHDVTRAYQRAVALPYSDWRPDDPQWQEALAAHSKIFSPEFVSITPADFTASAYVVDTLEIALYSLLHTTSYPEAIRTAVRFGGDTDTYAAIVGAAAGIAYGAESIPHKWLDVVKRRDYLEDLSKRFAGVHSPGL
ncbi:ADP-ribosylglycohydrolase family protein [Arcanobacterium ihumii]|uniref:ADP-ribosylglycohydrolase family protein n=1 Tax=Arcanobacterium ihumii TaxID=2138162 RepID=UPI000F524B82|nr:ADP-ribosylglycohydrolase family protein [Arcanobacterium ihumii]